MTLSQRKQKPRRQRGGSVNYDQRISFLKEWFKSDIVTRFNMPRDLDPTIVAMDVIDALNRNLPNQITQERMSHLVATTAKEVTQSAKTRTLPSVKEFTDGLRTAMRGDTRGATGPTRYVADHYAINAKRIAQCQAVPDMYLRDPHRKRLIKEHGLSEQDFEPYQHYLASTAHKQ